MGLGYVRVWYGGLENFMVFLSVLEYLSLHPHTHVRLLHTTSCHLRCQFRNSPRTRPLPSRDMRILCCSLWNDCRSVMSEFTLQRATGFHCWGCAGGQCADSRALPRPPGSVPRAVLGGLVSRAVSKPPFDRFAEMACVLSNQVLQRHFCRTSPTTKTIDTNT